MRVPVRFVLAAAAGALLVSGCALRDPRDTYAYGRSSDGLWDTEYDFLLDWNFPTSSSLGPIEAPQRFKPERPAIGVSWANGNPLRPPDAGQAPALEGAANAAPAPAAPPEVDATGQRDAQGADAPRTGHGVERGAGLEQPVTRR